MTNRSPEAVVPVRCLHRAPSTGSGQAESRWTREQIRAARLVALPPVLEKRGLALRETGGGNYRLPDFPGLIVKDAYWRWSERELSGNAIDFCTQVLRLSFHDAMHALLTQ